jgi:glycosyltransferase involved in cell wall biosynthesis
MDTGRPKGVSVIICCFNSADRLPPTLQHLAQQRVDREVEWEIILVDNASTDKTVETAHDLWAEYKGPGNFFVVSEEKPGLSAARHKGYETARFKYLLFCDDDNWLSPDYVQLCYDIMEKRPDVAVTGGQNVAAFETEAPGWFNEVAKSYAVGKQYETSGDVTWRDEKLWGAGSVYNSEALRFLYNNHFEQLMTDRIGNKITSGGDHELCCALRLTGYKLYYDERLKLTHYMTKGRLKWDWFINFYESAAKISVMFDAYNKALIHPRGFSGYLKDGAAYEIYLSLRKIFQLRPGLQYIFKTPAAGADKVWLSLFFEKHRILALMQHFFGYRSTLEKVRKSKWLVKGQSR